jgi:hypothetical protein
MIYSLCVAPTNPICHETYFSIFFQMVPIFFLLKRLIFKFYVNGFPCIFFVHELFFLSFLQIGAHVFFFQDLWKLVPMSSFLKIVVKLQVADPIHEQIKFVQRSIKSTQVWSSINIYIYFWNKSIASQPNWFKSTNFEALSWNQPCFGSFMEILE